MNCEAPSKGGEKRVHPAMVDISIVAKNFAAELNKTKRLTNQSQLIAMVQPLGKHKLFQTMLTCCAFSK